MFEEIPMQNNIYFLNNPSSDWGIPKKMRREDSLTWSIIPYLYQDAHFPFSFVMINTTTPTYPFIPFNSQDPTPSCQSRSRSLSPPSKAHTLQLSPFPPPFLADTAPPFPLCPISDTPNSKGNLESFPKARPTAAPRVSPTS